MIAKSARIHPLSVIEDGAVIGENVTVGPFCHVGRRLRLATVSNSSATSWCWV